MKSLKIRLKLSHNDQIKLNTLSNEHRLIYNKCLETAKQTNDFKEIERVGFQYRKENKFTIQAHTSQHTMIK